jgi:hypothetical protein
MRGRHSTGSGQITAPGSVAAVGKIRISGEFKLGGSEAQNLSAITFAAGSLGLSRDLTGGYSSALPLYRDGIAGRSHHYDAPTVNAASRRPVCADGSGDLNSLM